MLQVSLTPGLFLAKICLVLEPPDRRLTETRYLHHSLHVVASDDRSPLPLRYQHSMWITLSAARLCDKTEVNTSDSQLFVGGRLTRVYRITGTGPLICI